MSKKLEALKAIAKGFQMLYEAQVELEQVEQDVTVVPTEKPVVEEPVEEKLPKEENKTSNENSVETPEEKSISKEDKEEKPVKVKEELKQTKEEESKDDLDSMTDSELKALARDMGIKIKFGMKRQRILDEVREKIKEEKVKKEEVKESSKELPEDSLMKRLREETEDMTDDEIRELLSEADISEKGGRTALLAKLYDAVKNGIIKIDEDEEEEVSEEDGEDAIVSADDEDKDTPERIKAMEIFEKENRDAFEKGQLEVGDMKNFLKENFNITMPKKATPAEVLDKYIECASNFIDDEGNTVEEGAYCVKGVPHCCGVPLELTKDKSGKVTGSCKICGEVYDIDEED